jgi:iron complex transport system substrate-binding protein
MDKNITYIVAIVAIVALVIASYGFVAFEGGISDLNGSVSDLQEELATSQTTINNLETSITNMEGQLSTIETIEGQLETIQEQLSVYHSAITELETQMGVYNSNMSALEQQLSEQQEQINEYQETIQEQQEQINEYQQVTLADAYGNVITLTSAPERIVSLAPSNTEILFAIGAGDAVVGITDYCNYPYDFSEWVTAGNITSIGSYYGPSIEPIVALNPDLILASSGSLEAADTLNDLGYNVLVIEGKNIDAILQDVLLVGRATAKNNEASALVTSLRARLDAVAAKIASATTTPKVYYELWYEPLMSAGPETFINEIITRAGGENIFSDSTSSWPYVSSEEIISKNPDVILLPDSYMSDNLYDMDDVYERAGWNVITAIQNEALYEIVEDTVVRSGPRVVDAVEVIAALLHPELFGES